MNAQAYYPMENNQTPSSEPPSQSCYASCDLPKMPFKCSTCFYGNLGDRCSSALRNTKRRFPIIHRLMKKTPDGWIDLDYDRTGKCRFYVANLHNAHVANLHNAH